MPPCETPGICQDSTLCRPCSRLYFAARDVPAFLEKWRKVIGGASPTAEPWAIQFEEEAAALADELTPPGV